MQLIRQYKGLRKEIYILFVGRLVTAMGSFVWPMLTFFMTTRLGISDSLTTLLFGVSTLLSMPAVHLGGKMADRFSRKRIILCFDTLTFVLYSLAALLPEGYHTIGLVFLAGLGQTIEQPAYNALGADYSSTAQREKAMSLSYLGFNLGFVVGASLAGILFARHTALAFFLNGLAVFLSTVLIFFCIDPDNAIRNEEEMKELYSEYEQPVDASLSIREVLRDRRVVLEVLLAACIAEGANSIVGVLLPLQLKSAMGAEGAELYGFLSSLNGLVVIVFTPLLTILLKRLFELKKLAAGMLLFLIGMFLFSVGAPVWLLFAAMFLYTLGEVTTVLGNIPYTSRRIPASHRGRIGGISGILGTVSHAMVEFFTSFILFKSGNDYRTVWYIFLGIGLVACLSYVFLYKKDKRTFPKLYEGGM